MPLFGVNFTTEAYFEVEALDQEEAIDMAYEELYNSLVGEYEWDCNECLWLDGDEDDEFYDDEDLGY
jgi:hypothetical protein